MGWNSRWVWMWGQAGLVLTSLNPESRDAVPQGRRSSGKDPGALQRQEGGNARQECGMRDALPRQPFLLHLLSLPGATGGCEGEGGVRDLGCGIRDLECGGGNWGELGCGSRPPQRREGAVGAGMLRPGSAGQRSPAGEGRRALRCFPEEILEQKVAPRLFFHGKPMPAA